MNIKCLKVLPLIVYHYSGFLILLSTWFLDFGFALFKWFAHRLILACL